jgi:DNA-binding MurR/RpiR family transcriptional regulator
MNNRKYRNEEWLQEEFIEKDRTQTEIAAECDVSDMTIHRWRKKFDIEKPNTAQFAIQTDGYEQWMCQAGGGKADTVLVHRLLATLKVDELSELDGKHVHHKSGDSRDNRLENLEIVTPAEHIKRHT